MDINNGMMPLADIIATTQADDHVALSKKDKVKSTSAQFASIFVNEILQNARKAKLASGGLFDSDATKLSQKLYDQQLSSSITQDDSFGITKLIENELNSKGN